MRATVFLIAEGVLPGPKGRDSVTRLVIRRAARFGRKLGFEEPFLAQVADSVIEIMGGHFSELVERQQQIRRVITLEEQRFHRTLGRGLGELESMLATLMRAGHHTLPGEQAFYLTATLGLPYEVIRDVASERDMAVDLAGFEAAQEQHSAVSGAGKAMGVLKGKEAWSTVLADLRTETEPIYDPYGPPARETRLLALLQDAQPVAEAIAGDKVEVVLAETPFYVEAGGQVSDRGTIRGDGWLIEVENTRQPVSGLIVHVGEVVEGPSAPWRSASAPKSMPRDAGTSFATTAQPTSCTLRCGDASATTFSNAAPLSRRIVCASTLPMTPGSLHEELQQVEREVNEAILSDYCVQAVTMPLSKARAEGAMALFGEKYGEEVRTIRIGEGDERYSYELCGGLHVHSTQAIGQLRIVSEGQRERRRTAYRGAHRPRCPGICATGPHAVRRHRRTTGRRDGGSAGASERAATAVERESPRGRCPAPGYRPA